MNMDDYEPKPGDTITITIDLGRDFFPISAAVKAAAAYWKEIAGDLDDDANAALGILCTYYGRDHIDSLIVNEAENQWARYSLTDDAAAEVREMVDDFRDFHTHAPAGQEYKTTAFAYLKQRPGTGKPEAEKPVEIWPTVPSSYVFTLAKMSKYLFDPKSIYDNDNSVALATHGKNVRTYVYVNPHGAEHLDFTDERVHNALISVWEKSKGTAQRGICTLSDLTYAAGFSNCDTNRRSILEHLERMSRYEIVINNDEEIAAGLKYKPMTDSKGQLIAFNRIPVKVNKKVTDQAIRFLEPFLLTYCRNHGNQLSAVKHAVLEYPLQKSDITVALSEHLNKYLAWQSNEHSKNAKKLAQLKKADPVDEAAIAKLQKRVDAPTVVTFQTLYDVAQMEPGKKSKSLPKRICDYSETILKHYQTESIYRIASVNRGKDRFRITFSDGE